VGLLSGRPTKRPISQLVFTMKFFLLGLLFGLPSALAAQTPATSVQPGGVRTPLSAESADRAVSRSKPAVAVPTLGFVADPSGAGVIAIRGIASVAAIGEAIPKPEGVSRIYLPPRQQYALVEQTGPESIALWHLARPPLAAEGNTMLDTITGTLAHPDIVAFSPKGSSAALWSNASGRLQIITGLPGRPATTADISVAEFNHPEQIALSDDGQVVLTADANGQIGSAVTVEVSDGYGDRGCSDSRSRR
jgi:hypothetical protein